MKMQTAITVIKVFNGEVNTTRTLGLDVGDRRIGVALSDPGGILASPFAIIERADDDQSIAAITDIVQKQVVSLIVAGLPQSLSGAEGQQAEKVRAFIEKLSERVPIPVVFRDERLSTVAVSRLMQSVGSHKGKKKERQDARAAAVILQGYLDERKNHVT
jgi:putative Holliday junction resolvase